MDAKTSAVIVVADKSVTGSCRNDQSHDKQGNTAPPLLYRLCVEFSSGKVRQKPVVERTISHPSEATYVGRCGRTALHELVFGYLAWRVDPGPMRAVLREVFRANPKAATLGDDLGSTPLHLAMKKNSLDIVDFLVRANPEAATVKNEAGDTPLHIAICDSRRAYISYLLRYSAEAASVRNSEGNTPLHMLCYLHLTSRSGSNDYNINIKLVPSLVEAFPEASAFKGTWPRWSGREDRSTPLALLTFKWEKMIRVALTRKPSEEDLENATYLFRHPNIPEGRLPFTNATNYWDAISSLVIAMSPGTRHVLHACLGIEQCPTDVILLALRLQRNQLEQPDTGGNLPLHVAAANSNLNGCRVQVYAVTKKRKRREGDDTAASCCESYVRREEDLMAKLTGLHPTAANVRNLAGRWPLHLALESGKKWETGIEAIANAQGAGHVVRERDVTTNLFPFMAAAVGEEACLTTVYELFRRCPDLNYFGVQTNI